MELKVLTREKDGFVVFLIGYEGHTASQLLKAVHSEKDIEHTWVSNDNDNEALFFFSKKKANKLLNILIQDLNCSEYVNREV